MLVISHRNEWIGAGAGAGAEQSGFELRPGHGRAKLNNPWIGDLDIGR